MVQFRQSKDSIEDVNVCLCCQSFTMTLQTSRNFSTATLDSCVCMTAAFIWEEISGRTPTSVT